jgi:hypothetical protein
MKKPLKDRLRDGLTVVAAKTYDAAVDTGRAFTSKVPDMPDVYYAEDIPVWEAQNKFARTLTRKSTTLDKVIAIVGLAACERELRRRERKRKGGEG